MTAAPASGGPADGKGEAGFVLLSVLLAIALFMAAAASFAIKSQLAAMQAGNRLEQARARALADGAVLFAADALAAAQAPAAPARPTSGTAPPANGAAQAPPARIPPLPFASDGTPLSCALSDGRAIEIAMVDQGGLLDLNAASPEMIVDLLRSTGLDGERALQAVGGIVDFRDENDQMEAGGASEAAAYREAGKPWGPRNGAFLDPAEIAQLPAFAPDLVARLQPLFTVENARPGLDFTVMDRRARALFPREIEGVDELGRWREPSPRIAFALDAALRRIDGTVAAARHGLVAFDDTSALAQAVEEIGMPRPPRLRDWREVLVPPRSDRPPASTSPTCQRLRRALEGAAGSAALR